MFKKTITYTDFNGIERTEDYYFNLSKNEITKLQFGNDALMSDTLERILAAKDLPSLMKVFDQIIILSYGEKSEDGRYFMKNDEIRERFKCSPAYDQIYMSFLEGNEDESAQRMLEFVNGIMPTEVRNAIDKQLMMTA